jgi:hypothetical protein
MYNRIATPLLCCALVLVLAGCPGFAPKSGVGAGGSSSTSNPNAPDFDGLVAATATSQSKAYLSWNASSVENVTYNIYYSKDLKTKIATTSETGFLVTGLSASTTYSFIVRAENEDGDEDSNKVTKSITTLSYTVPEFNGITSVSQITTSSLGMTRLKLYWSIAGGSVTGYQVFMGTSSDSVDTSTPVATISANTSNSTVGAYVANVGTTNATVDGLNPGTTYYFTVRAFYWDGSTNYIELNPIVKSGTTLSTAPPATNPRVTSLRPGAGPLAGGTLITITGSGFASGATVSLGGTACTQVAVLSDTEISCITAAKTAGAVNVVVTNTDTGVGTLTNGFTYTTALPPTVSSLSPSSGPLSGGTTVTITGANFVTGATVSFGSSRCSNATFVSATSLTCVTPAAAAGASDVTVTNPDTQYGTLAAGYLYNPAPTITSISPPTGSIGGSTLVTITGTNFTLGATISLGGTDCNFVNVLSSTQIQCQTGAHAQGLVALSIINLDGQTYTKPSAFTYQAAPTVASVLPSAGALAGGTSIIITGTGFAAGATVNLGITACTSPTIISSAQISCVTPANALGSVDVIVTNADGQFGTLSSGYAYQAAPTLTAISPQFGPLAGGTTLTLTGTGFKTGATISIGGSPCGSVSIASLTSATCVTTAHAQGTVTATFTNRDGQAASLSSGFSYTAQPAPTLSAVSPPIGHTSGGRTITITGTGFLTGATVSIGGSNCASVSVASSTSLTCVTTAHSAATVDIVLTNGDLQQSTLVGQYTYTAVPAPSLISISPAIGNPAGGTYVTLTGSGFQLNAVVTVGGGTCTSPSVLSQSSMTCFTPAHAAGTGTVVVTNTDTQTGTLTDGFTYQDSPTVSSILPSGGSPNGGTNVLVTGTNFVNGSTVTIAGLTCTNPVILSSTQITCDTPAHAAAIADVSVNNPDNSFGTLAAAYTYRPGPVIDSLSPRFGSTAGGTSVTVTGSSFTAGMSFVFGGVPCTSVNVVSSTTATCTTGTHSQGIVSAVATNPDTQVYTMSSAFSYTAASAPAISAISPAAGQITGGQTVTLTGNNFLSGATVALGGVSCTSVSVVSVTSITCTTGASSAGTVDVVVTNGDYQTGTLTNGFLYTTTPAPILSSVSPPGGPLAGGITLNLSGQYFNPSVVVTIGGNSCTPVNFGSSTTISCPLPAHAAGLVDVRVTNPDTQTSLLSSVFSYQGAPTISGISPTAGTPDGGTTITIFGTNFLSGAAVTLGGQSCTSISVVNSGQMTCVTQSHPLGTVDLAINNPDGQSVSSTGAFTYQLGPKISRVNPSMGQSGTTMVVFGYNFLSGAAVTVGGTPCTASSFVSSVRLTCTIPTLTSGAKDVVVTNPDSQTYTLSNAFTYGSGWPWTTVTLFSGALSQVGFADSSGAVGMFNGPGGITIDAPNNYAYIADSANYTIRKMDLTSGAVTTFAGRAGYSACADGNSTNARFGNPTAITNDGTYLYVTDTSCQTIRRIDMSTADVVVFAGTNGAGFTDAQGVAARFNDPSGISNDGTYLYVADRTNHAIRRITISDATVFTVAGTGVLGAVNGAGSIAQFNQPMDVIKVGNYLYVADLENNVVRRIDLLDGFYTTTTFAGTFGASNSTNGIGSAAAFYRVSGLTYDGSYIYAVDTYASTIRKIDPATASVTSFAGSTSSYASVDGTGSAARFFNPIHIAYDGSAYLYLADSSNALIRKIRTTTAAVTTVAGPVGAFGYVDSTASASRFRGIYDATSDGTYMYAVDAGNNAVRKITLSSGASTLLAGDVAANAATTDGVGTGAKFNDPRGVTNDGNYLYVTEYTGHTIRKVDMSSGVVTTLAGAASLEGSTDATGTSAKFKAPLGITTDNVNLYVTDSGNCTIRQIVISTGVVTTIAGTAGVCGTANGTGSAAQFSRPSGITTDGTNLFVADSGNCSIRKVVISSGVVTSLAGVNGVCGGAVDGGSPVFDDIEGITTDGTYVYVAEYTSNNIRRVNIATGVSTTLSGRNARVPRADVDGTLAAAYFENPVSVSIILNQLYVMNRYGIRAIH